MENSENDTTTYAPVWLKKTEGRLVLTPNHLEFQSTDPPLTIPWTSITKHQVSPATYPKALLKLLGDKHHWTFRLSNRPELERIRHEITRRKQAPVDTTSLAVTRASLLASNPTLRQHYHSLVPNVVSDDEFWQTHANALGQELARIQGLAKAGASSSFLAASATSDKVQLGVEEMRQIFILYPAVHQAYEDKVPLELSDEQFWRKYLESEYIHRDRGRRGGAEEQQRAQAVGTDDLFSRYEPPALESERQWGSKLGVGQFDLASTFATERGEKVFGQDLDPANPTDDGKGARVIDKYNRHWAMVLHPDEAVAGANLTEVARKSVQLVAPNDRSAEPLGGVDEEHERLVAFAGAKNANHVAGVSLDDEDPASKITLANIESYYTGKRKDQDTTETDEETRKRQRVFAQSIVQQTQALVTNEACHRLSETCFPPPQLGRELLSALTKKMAQDAQSTDEPHVDLPPEARERLHGYFRRSSELLRHFFALRSVDAPPDKIVTAMEQFHREMEETVRKDLPETETVMRKMYLSIMDQLDWAFQLHRKGKGGGGGFVAVST